MGGIDSGSVLMSPLSGSAIPIGNFPGAVGRANSGDIQRSGSTYVPDVLQQTVPGVIVEDAQGNVFQKSLQFRGFDSSPVNGAPQGLAVYQNGVRINESFGDIVNWDFLPDNSINGITIIGAILLFVAKMNVRVTLLAAIAVVMACFNVVGGFAVTDRMLRFFKNKAQDQ